jgi:hypothetical protein
MNNVYKIVRWLLLSIEHMIRKQNKKYMHGYCVSFMTRYCSNKENSKKYPFKLYLIWIIPLSWVEGERGEVTNRPICFMKAIYTII